MKAKNAIYNTGTIQAGTVHVGGRTTTRLTKGRRPAMPYPIGSIGSDLAQRNYVKYLVERYHRYREADASFGRTGRLKYATLFKNIEAKFKVPTYFIPQRRFDELVDYLQARIDKTILGRRNNSRGVNSLESFDEYKLRHISADDASERHRGSAGN